MLNISYNTTRLKTIIEEFVEKKDYRDRRKSENRGKPASKFEITNAIESFLHGNNISDISQRMYRSPSFVKGIIERAGVPRKRSKEERGEDEDDEGDFLAKGGDEKRQGGLRQRRGGSPRRRFSWPDHAVARSSRWGCWRFISATRYAAAC